ncbi:Secretion ATPase, PEP-CTERM locus subfamily [Desulfamplus magnetovallimortis]|uniref:Secretion ATPase, PEP-CTERM locus subfamily n=1 Tax=Desulfamplus magnetovallimortis TaxID=1246637 RepID=A0A1W1HE21_9BACT|nr:AAA family ATPase [Desulfamplus magnetovallimortis]SLM30638.1 Secretion ATPase, PEP-CTERM locus subfamily [Desulfamplus magnetovallimortis]
MYTQFYGLTEKPFGLVPNPAYLYLSSRHQNALTYLEYGLAEKVGFIMLTGDIGMGKTTLVRHILNKVESEMEVAVIFNTMVLSNDLLHLILSEFEIPFDSGLTKGAALELLYKYLIDCYSSGKKVLLIIDEAQNLSHEVLEEIRMISNLQTDDEMLIQIMLVGQPELKEKIASPALRQFAQRIAVSYHLSPMEEDETLNYIAHRIKVAGGDPDLFEKDALTMIINASGGIPRVVNLLCDACLVYGFADSLEHISANVIEQVISDKGGIGIFLPGVNDGDNGAEFADNSAATKKDNVKCSGVSVREYSELYSRVALLEKHVEQLQTTMEKHILELESRADFSRDQLINTLKRMVIIEKQQNLKIAFDYISRKKDK